MTKTFDQALRAKFLALREGMFTHIVGYRENLDMLMLAVLMGGNVMEEGIPGVGKTYKMKVLGRLLGVELGRVQMTPATDPASIIGFFALEDGKFVYKKGSFTKGFELILVDEINRTSPDTQSATLEAMGEGHVTVEDHRTDMPKFFICVCTKNPIESEGVYPVPKAQRDRMAIELYYPRATEDELILIAEMTALTGDRTNLEHIPTGVCSTGELLLMRKEIETIDIPTEVKRYCGRLVFTADPDANPKLKNVLASGLGARAMIWLFRLAAARAWTQSRSVVTHEDVQAVFVPILRARMFLADDVEPGDYTAESVAQIVFDAVPILKKK